MIKIGQKQIDVPVKIILEKIRAERLMQGQSYFKNIKNAQHALQVTCPVHKNHQENHPSCGVFTENYMNFKEGDFHCFTCGCSGSIFKLVGICFDKDDQFGKEWLLDNFNTHLLIDNTTQKLPEIKLDNDNDNVECKDEDLTKYDSKHPYMYQRKLSDYAINRFKIGYDKEKDMITFPCWDANNNLISVNKRSVKGKYYLLEQCKSKPIYLLNFLKEDLLNGVNYNCVAIVESQINALYLNSLFSNIFAVALMGTGSSEQYEILNKSGITNYILCFDGDLAGRHGAKRFMKNIRKDAIVTDVVLPLGKDINDLSKEEIVTLFNNYNIKTMERTL